MVREDNHFDDSDDEFYDHDQVLPATPEPSSSPARPFNDYSSLQRQFEDSSSTRPNGSTLKCYTSSAVGGAKRRQQHSVFFTIIVVIVSVCVLLFIVTVIQYSHCRLTSTVTAQCQYSRVVARLNDNLSALNRRFVSLVGLESSYRWVSWPIRSPNSNVLSLDPLISWFFSQYEPV